MRFREETAESCDSFRDTSLNRPLFGRQAPATAGPATVYGSSHQLFTSVSHRDISSEPGTGLLCLFGSPVYHGATF
jgi:hypothetical protein